MSASQDGSVGSSSGEAIESESYAHLGVSSGKQEVHGAVAALPPGLYSTAFCRVVPDLLSGDPNYCVISHADGAGTKSVLAYMHYRIYQDASVFKGIAQDSIVMNLDDMICTGATSGFTLAAIVNRNAKRVDSSVLAALIDGTMEFITLMEEYGVKIVHCGGETADIGDAVRTVTVDSVMTARLPRESVVKNRIRPGSAIVAMASGGEPSIYEQRWNSGIGSNGLTLARHALLSAPPEIPNLNELVDDEIEDRLVYRGPFAATDILPDTDVSVISSLLSPTRTYAPIMAAVLSEYGPGIDGIVHCSGGGQLKCLRFGQGVKYIIEIDKVESPLFRQIHNTSGLSWGEMAKVFNLGFRMEVFCSEGIAEGVREIAANFQVESSIVGLTVPSETGNNILDITIEGSSYSYGGAVQHGG